ncbi:MAG: FKBP-type peptidyl-prolyl cis-trans isomerase, partial [Planctomycetota bacterium]
MRRLEILLSLVPLLFSACSRSPEAPVSTAAPEPARTEAAAKTEAASAEPVRLPSGIEYTVLKEGEGESPKIGSTVTTHFKSWFPDGRVFKDTWARGQPKKFKLDHLHLVPGWVEVLRSMKPGERRKVRIPSHLAYGAGGYPGVVPPNTDLNFEIELVAA